MFVVDFRGVRYENDDIFLKLHIHGLKEKLVDDLYLEVDRRRRIHPEFICENQIEFKLQKRILDVLSTKEYLELRVFVNLIQDKVYLPINVDGFSRYTAKIENIDYVIYYESKNLYISTLYKENKLLGKIKRKDPAFEILDITTTDRLVKLNLRMYSDLFAIISSVNSLVLVSKNSNVKHEIKVESTINQDKLQVELPVSNMQCLEDFGIWDVYFCVRTVGEEEYIVKCTKGLENKNSIFVNPIVMPTTLGNVRFQIYFNEGSLYMLNRTYHYSGTVEKVGVKEQGIFYIEGIVNFERKIQKVIDFGIIVGSDFVSISPSACEFSIVENDYLKYSLEIDALDHINSWSKEDTCPFAFKIIDDQGTMFYLYIYSNEDGVLNKGTVVKFPWCGSVVNDEIVSYKMSYLGGNKLGLAISKKLINQIAFTIKEEKLIVTGYTVNNLAEEITLVLMSNSNSIKRYENQQCRNQVEFIIPKDDFSCADIQLFVEFENCVAPISSERNFELQINTIDGNNIFLLGNKNAVVTEMRKESKLARSIKNLFARQLAKYLPAKGVWLIGENLAEVAQDNGFAFFKYCIDEENNKSCYYVTKENNAHMANLLQYKNQLVKYDSFKHLYYYYSADYLVVSHGIRDVIPTIMHSRMKTNKKKIIYLQHGIIAMKKIFFSKSSYNGKIIKFITSSEKERDIVVKQMDFRPEQVVVTGLARFDSLKDRSEKNTVLIMPTWREWLQASRESFESSDFYQNYITLLKSPELKALAKKHNLDIVFYPHFEIQKKYMDLFDIDEEHVSIANLDGKPLKELMEESKVMITDYSSVAFDFMYMKKPVIYFQFDENKYLRTRGSFVDFENELIGKSCSKIDEVVEALTTVVDRDYTMLDEELRQVDKYIKYLDGGNCKRIYKVIKNLKK